MEQPERYPGIFLPGDAPFYEDFGLYYLDRDDLDEVAERVEKAGPLLATLVDRPELPVLLGALTHVVESPEGLSSIGEDGSRILDRAALAVERFNEGGHAPIAWEDLLFEDLGSDHANPQLLFVRPAGDLTQLEPVMEAITAIRAMAPDLAPRPGLRVRVTGDRAVHTEEMSLIIGEAILSICVSLVLVTLILWVCLRSFRLLIATVLTLLVGLTWTAGLAGLAVGHLNALTSAFAVIYIGLAVDFGIHLGLGYLEQRRLGKDVATGAARHQREHGQLALLVRADHRDRLLRLHPHRLHRRRGHGDHLRHRRPARAPRNPDLVPGADRARSRRIHGGRQVGPSQARDPACPPSRSATRAPCAARRPPSPWRVASPSPGCGSTSTL